MSIEIKPLKKELYDKAVALGVEEIVLRFSGGNDEGYLNIEINPEWNADLSEQVETWAWEVYWYSGAGDGSDYGDDVTYDLVNKRARSQEWYMRREDGDVRALAFEEIQETAEEDSK